MTIEEGAQPFIQSTEEKRLEREKDLEAQEMCSNDESMIQPQASEKWVLIPTKVFKQQHKHYCGPATVKEVVHAIKGSSERQIDYARELGTTSDGTDMLNIEKVLNKKTNKKYTMSSIGSLGTWKSRILADMKKKMPVVMDIKTTTSFWKYKTDGHFLPIVGINQPNSKFTRVRLADPHTKYYGLYTVTAGIAYKANGNHWRHAMIW